MQIFAQPFDARIADFAVQVVQNRAFLFRDPSLAGNQLVQDSLHLRRIGPAIDDLRVLGSHALPRLSSGKGDLRICGHIRRKIRLLRFNPFQTTQVVGERNPPACLEAHRFQIRQQQCAYA
jgi:hypothetical protein